MKKILSIFLVTMLAMVSMSSMIIDPPPVVTFKPKFIIKNLGTNDESTVELKDFSPGGTYDVPLRVRVGDELEITYQPQPLLSPFTYQVTWKYGWGSPEEGGTKEGMIVKVPVGYLSTSSLNKFAVKCMSSIEGKSEDTKIYTMYFEKSGNYITVKNSDASEVQVTYENYEEVSSAGQRASTALYDIYGNLVSSGYLDGFGKSTLSTKGKPGLYIVKVIMNNQVIFNQRIQVK
ncbi:MAG: hypothetical protein K2I66_07055 [Bacteroidales bacterium]|nr:hypothetical protein [Bacteroidales bacterium]